MIAAYSVVSSIVYCNENYGSRIRAGTCLSSTLECKKPTNACDYIARRLPQSGEQETYGRWRGKKKSWCCDGLKSTVPWRLQVTWRWCCEASRSARIPRINLKNKCVRSLNGSRIGTRRRDKVGVSDRGVICRRASTASWRYRYHRKRLFYVSQTTHTWELFQRVRIAKTIWHYPSIENYTTDPHNKVHDPISVSRRAELSAARDATTCDDETSRESVLSRIVSIRGALLHVRKRLEHRGIDDIVTCKIFSFWHRSVKIGRVMQWERARRRTYRFICFRFDFERISLPLEVKKVQTYLQRRVRARGNDVRSVRDWRRSHP